MIAAYIYGPLKRSCNLYSCVEKLEEVVRNFRTLSKCTISDTSQNKIKKIHF